VNATFFGLAFTAALNPKLLGADLLIIGDRRPRAMFICFLAGGLGMSITIGIVDVLFMQADAVKTQRSVGASVDLALGLCLLVFGALVATDRVGRRRTPAEEAKGQSWSDRILRQPRLGLAFVIGALAGTPGGELHPRAQAAGPEQRPCRVAGGRRSPVLPDPVLADDHPVPVPRAVAGGHEDAAARPQRTEREGVDFGGAVNVIYRSAAGLTSVGDQFWSQNSPGVARTAEADDIVRLVFGRG
jgi:Sap, sulfolipid-1-addressing protein